MSDVNVEGETPEAPQSFGGTIVIEISADNINYNSGTMPLPEVVLWLETVKSMIVRKILGEGV